MGAVYVGVAVAIIAVAASFAWGMSLSGSIWIGACVLATVGFVAAIRQPLRRAGLQIALAALAFATIGSISRPIRADGRAHLITLPGGASAGPTGALVDEGDIVLPAAQSYVLSGNLNRDEARHVVANLRTAYDTMRAEEGIVPTPWRPDPAPGPTLVFEPHSARTQARSAGGHVSDVAVLFLHGYAGSFAVQCWEVARAADAIGAITVCPSSGFEGAWWTRAGEARAREAIAYLRGRGVQRIYLAGLSNGGIGASRLAPRLANDLDGLVLLSGVASNARPTALPTLVVQGRRDHMTPPAPARRYARSGGRHVQYVEIDGTHFLLVERSDEVRDVISRWLFDHERAARTPKP